MGLPDYWRTEMLLCKIDQRVDSTVGVVVTLHYDSETREYRVRVAGNPSTDYFTHDLLDADKTMTRMFDQEVKTRPPLD